MDSIEEFTRRICGREGYVAQFLVTLEINKLEAAHQKPDEPIVFRKRVDDLGIVEWFEMNPRYRGNVPEPKTGFAHEEGQLVVDFLESESPEGVATIFLIGEIEHVLLPGRLAKDPDCTPLLLKTCDERGFPTAWKFNAPESEISSLILTMQAYESGHQA